jgi:hypothetical protein
MRYETRYVHKIAPSEKDVGKAVDLSPLDLESKTKLASALRRAGIIDGGISSYRIEKDRVIVFPQDSIWHSIILHLPGTAALPPRKTGPDTYKHFAYRPPAGSKQPMRWFRSSSPVEWSEARDRLIKAGVIKASQSGWSLSIDKNDYNESRAEKLP